MQRATPAYLLFTDAQATSTATGRWRFVLESVDGRIKFSASDIEPEAARNRLELMAVVRGLEAIEEKSRVTLVTPSRYVQRGLSQGLAEWREQDWKWERFGKAVPIRDQDLWQRVDRALEFHRLTCRLWRAGEAQSCAAGVEHACSAPLAPPVEAASSGNGRRMQEAACVAAAPVERPAKRATDHTLEAEEGVLIVRRARPRRIGLHPQSPNGRSSGRLAQRVWAMCQNVVRPALAGGAPAGA